MIVVTGATGQLGQLVIKSLLQRVPAQEVVAAVRTPSKAADLAALGVTVRQADYSKPETLGPALAGATSVLLISSTNLGARVGEHKAVIDAAKKADVQFFAYTSVLRADSSTLLVAPDHVATEQFLIQSGLPYSFLRNGWYIENHTANLAEAVKHGVILGAAGDGRISGATRADYGEAAAVVLSTPGHENKIYELGGDTAYTVSEIAAVVTKQSGKQVVYNNLSEQAYEEALKGFGLPDPIAHLLADSDDKVSKGELYTMSKDLSTLIGRATTTLENAVSTAFSK